MAGIKNPPEDSDLNQNRVSTTIDSVSDDDRSIAADSWSIKSEYGSTLDDDQRHNDSFSFRASSDYSSDKEEPDAELVTSMLGFRNYWDATYAGELANFREHGHTGEIWFGAEIMDTMASWTRRLCIGISVGKIPNYLDDVKSEHIDQVKPLSNWSVLDIGTGNGVLLQEFAKQGFSDLTGVDYSEGAIVLALNLAESNGFSNIKFLVDDVLETKLERKFRLVLDKGTLDAVGLHPDGSVKRIMYWDSVSRLVSPGGLLVITLCNHTKDELVQEVSNYNQMQIGSEHELMAPFRYIDHIRSYPTFTFAGMVGSRVATVAFLRN